LNEENPTFASSGHENGFGSAIIAVVAVAGESRSRAVHLQKRV
jgi:hypothetical protein